MSRIKRGWTLTKKSWGLLRGHPELLRFPLYGAIATIPLAFLTLGPGLYLWQSDAHAGAIPFLVLGYFLLAAVGTYFNVGLAAAADMTFRGQAATVSDGLAVARARFPQICGWAALSAAIGVVMGALENQGGLAGQIAARVVGMAWALVTFVAAPVIAFEGTGAFTTLKRSASIFRAKWGQQITGNVAIGGAVALLIGLPAGVTIGIGVLAWASAPFVGALLIIVGAVALAIAAVVSSALSGIFGVALYRYATEGQAVGGFTAEELESAVRAKKGRSAGPAQTPGTI